MARLDGQLQEQKTIVNVLAVSPEWLTLRARLLAALEAYPEARLAAAEALNGAG